MKGYFVSKVKQLQGFIHKSVKGRTVVCEGNIIGSLVEIVFMKTDR